MSPRSLAAFPLVALCLAAPAGAGAAIDEDAVLEAIVRIRQALPEAWSVADIRWNTAPFGWEGDSTCVLVRLEDGSVQFPHSEEEFSYRPFYKLWLLPFDWQGRMAIAPLEETTPNALYLGDGERVRVFYRSLGRNSWPEAPEELSEALGLHAYPLTHAPRHTLDIPAMQALWRRLDTRPGALERWQRQIWALEELPDLIYLELLTWDDRRGARDPTFLGELAERETEYLCREVLATFPGKRGVYLRRVSQSAFGDVLVVNRARIAPSP